MASEQRSGLDGDEEKTPTVRHAFVGRGAPDDLPICAVRWCGRAACTRHGGAPIRYEAPEVTPVGNMNDLVRHVPACGDPVEQLGPLHALPEISLSRLAASLLAGMRERQYQEVGAELLRRCAERASDPHASRVLERLRDITATRRGRS